MVNEAAWVWFGMTVTATAFFLLAMWRGNILQNILAIKSKECDQLQQRLDTCQKKINEAKAWLEYDEEESDGE